MLSAEATALIRRSPRDILEFVLDLERYRQADTKIGRVDFVERNGNAGRARSTRVRCGASPARPRP